MYSEAHVCTIVKPKNLQVKYLRWNPSKEGPREDSRSTDKQPDESCPQGISDVNDGGARHVAVMRQSN